MNIIRIIWYNLMGLFICATIAGYIYLAAQTPHYKIVLPAHMSDDINAGDVTSNDVMSIYLSKTCVHCIYWELNHKDAFEKFAKDHHIKITYRYLKDAYDENTRLYVKKGIINTPSYIYKDYYYKGAPQENFIDALKKTP